MIADKHPQQGQRLETLESYNILDTDADADFDDIVTLASKICDTPITLISLVDDDRQWFKARKGFDAAETSLEESVCSHAILEGGFLEIQDMSADTRTADNPLHLAEDGVQFYAGANLIAPDGLPIGTLCVLDTKPRELTDLQREALQTLSRQVMMQMELRKKVREEAALRSEMDHRVKNSLQTIASIMRLAAKEVTDPKALEVLDLVNRRLEAVASLHSELMGSDGKSSVDTQSYFQRLHKLVDAVSPANIVVEMRSDAGTLEARKASAIGMIVSEFVANSVKHAFPDGQRGNVSVALVKEDANNWVLTCTDDGAGKRAQPADSNGPGGGLGQMLMQSAAMQLGGSVAFEVGENGALLNVAFAGSKRR